jgi:hypothetical protein
MPQFSQWDPGRVTASAMGIPMRGFATGEFIKAAYNSDAFTVQSGAQGDAVRVRSRDQTGTVTFTLQASSPTNDLLLARAKLDRLFGTGYGPLLVQDLNGTTRIRASRCWIKKVPDATMATDPSDREWVIECFDLEIEPGGNVIQ